MTGVKILGIRQPLKQKTHFTNESARTTDVVACCYCSMTVISLLHPGFSGILDFINFSC